jgi:16S rRNA processing protein RimM
VGKIVNTHGLKGEIRILSTFDMKEEIFKPNFILYIDEKPYKIHSYRKHKNYDMVTFEGMTSIEDVLFLKGKKVYMNRTDLKEDIILESDLIGMDILSHKGKRGRVISIKEGVQYHYLEVALKEKTYYIPNIPAFISKIDKKNNEIYIQEIEGLIDEN